MGNNSFLEPAANMVRLERELCQRIHYEALHRAMHGYHPEAVPPTIDLSSLGQRVRLFGREVCLSHPETIDSLFSNISMGVYRRIVELYCSRLERSIAVVWKIIQVMANEAGSNPIPYETVWALCMHLEEHRQHETAVTLEQVASTWSITLLYCQEGGQSEGELHNGPLIMCLLDLSREVVLAFRVIGQQQISEAYGLVLYDALIQQRRPARESAAGLRWQVPKHLIVEGALPQNCCEGCTHLGISFATGSQYPAFFQSLQTSWRNEVSRRRLRVSQWANAFDSYLHKAIGYSPLRSSEERDDAYHHLVGYNRDPAWQCPALRSFLPLHTSSIAADGTISYNGLHYTDDLLVYWTESTVTLRQSQHTESLIWVYLEGGLLCQAHARELRRHDGSYSSFRPARR